MKFYGFFESHKKFLVFEFMSCGDLHSFLEKNSVKLSLQELLWFCIHIATGMSYIHTLGTLHNDLACRNVLVCRNDGFEEGEYIAKICGMFCRRKKKAELEQIMGCQLTRKKEIMLLGIVLKWFQPDGHHQKCS